MNTEIRKSYEKAATAAADAAEAWAEVALSFPSDSVGRLSAFSYVAFFAKTARHAAICASPETNGEGGPAAEEADRAEMILDDVESVD